MSWSTSELRVRLAPWNWIKPSSNFFLLTVPRRYFFCGSFMFFLSCVCYVLVRICLFVPCGHLLGKDWSLGSRLWCLTVSLSLSHWYPGSCVVIDCIDSWSLHPYLLCPTWSHFIIEHIFFISQPKHMLWVFKRTISVRQFFWVPKTYVLNIHNFKLKTLTRKFNILTRLLRHR